MISPRFQIMSISFLRWTLKRCSPQTTLELPPEGKLMDRLVDNAVQDFVLLTENHDRLDGMFGVSYIQDGKC